AQLLSNPEHLRQPKARSFADFLRCEERLKHLVENLIRDACAGIGNGTSDIIARRWLLGAPRRTEPDVRGSDCDCSTARHRISRVDSQVQDDKFDLASIGERQREWMRKNSFNLVTSPDGTLKQPAHSCNDPIKIDCFRGHTLLSREGEELCSKS